VLPGEKGEQNQAIAFVHGRLGSMRRGRGVIRRNQHRRVNERKKDATDDPLGINALCSFYYHFE
jgi:hypothetical protein